MMEEEARSRFSEALEGSLSEEEQQSFDAALTNDASLRDAYEDFKKVFRMAHAGATEPDGGADDEDDVDVLPRVQEALHRRSRGRYYRDRFSRRGHEPMGMMRWGLGLSVLVLLLCWFAMQQLRVELPSGDGTDPASPGGTAASH